MIDADPRTERACTLLRFSFPDLALLPVRNLAVTQGHGEGLSSAGDASAEEASPLAPPLEIAELSSSLRDLVDRPGFSFADFPKSAPAGVRLSSKARDQLVRFIRQIHVQLREIELGLVNEQAFAGLQ